MKRLSQLMNSIDHISRQSKWIRKTLKAYWLIVVVHNIVQILSFYFTEYLETTFEFYTYVIVIPTLVMSSVILLAEWIRHRTHKYPFALLIFSSTIIAWTIIRVNYDIRIIPAMCLLPIFSSVIFFKRYLIWIAFFMQLACFFLLYSVDPSFRMYLSIFDVVAIPTFLILGTIFAYIIYMSGRDLMMDLQTNMTAKQDLMISNAIISKMSKTDGLTKLYNHISFQDFYEKALEYAGQGVVLHLALIDIDNFKHINDTYGHQIGDKILERISQIILQDITSNDIAARYGGEEFALLLFEYSFEEAYELMEQIRQDVAQLSHDEMGGSSVTVSIGLKGYAQDSDKESLFEEVDAYLYKAKRTGKNKTVTFCNMA